jgi:hypothetical protein
MIEYLSKNLVLITAVITAIRWLYEYSQNRKFNKNKFLLEKIQEFNNLDSIKTVNRLLDWNALKIDINGVPTLVDDTILINALITHNQRSTFNQTEVYLRGIFDEYFDEIRELIILADCGLVDRKNLKRFLKYWIEILNGTKKSKSKEFIKTIDDYLTFYDFMDVKDFISNKKTKLFDF